MIFKKHYITTFSFAIVEQGWTISNFWGFKILAIFIGGLNHY